MSRGLISFHEHHKVDWHIGNLAILDVTRGHVTRGQVPVPCRLS